MAIGDPISQPIPPVGTAGTTYASQIVAFLTEVKARLEAKVAMASLLVALLDMANNAFANVKYVGLYDQGSLSGFPTGAIARLGGELYYVSAAGNVRITNAGHLDVVAALGITGDYAAPAEFRYDLATTTYFAYSDQTATPKKWARLAAMTIDLYGSLTSTTRVRLAWTPGSSYTLTLPAAPPGAQTIAQMDASGNIILSNTIPQDVILGNNINFTFQGTGYIKHGNWGYNRPFMAGGVWAIAAGSPPTYASAGALPNVLLAASGQVYYPLDLGHIKNRIKSITVYARPLVATATFSLYRGAAMGSGTQSMSAMNLSGATTATTLDVTADGLYLGRTLTLSSPYDFSDGSSVWLRVDTTATGTCYLITYTITEDAV